MDKIKKLLLSIPATRTITVFVWHFVKSFILYCRTRKELLAAQNDKNRIFYLGIPAHGNLGDLAQGLCIRRWLQKHYSNRVVVEIETNALVNTCFSVLPLLKKLYDKNDFIVFQSGYTTTDLGGFADEMHRAVIKALPDARMLMLPQTIFFVSEENKKRTAQSYNSQKNMLFLARDAVSYSMAQEMFLDIPVVPYPDIVTTLIGEKRFAHQRNGILFCCRNDGEKYYTDEEIEKLIHKCEALCSVKRTDTTKDGRTAQIVANAQMYIQREIEEYARYRLIITDRYHGTILSLVAGTPVIIMKTTDHKVTTGADWFKGIYDSHVFLAEDLDAVYVLAEEILSKQINYELEPYFEKEYYDKLPKLFEQMTNGERV